MAVEQDERTRRVAVWLDPPRLAKLEKARAMLGLRYGKTPGRPAAVEAALDELLDLLEEQGGDTNGANHSH